MITGYPPPTGLKKCLKFVYDFSVLGGATGSIVLTTPDGVIPANFVVQNAWIDVLTAPDSATHLSTFALTSGEGAGDLVVAALVSGAPWSTAGRKVTIPLLGTIATWIKTTVQRSPAVVVAVEALTAGKFNLFVEGMVSV